MNIFVTQISEIEVLYLRVLINCHDFHIDIVSGIEFISAAVALKQSTN